MSVCKAIVNNSKTGKSLDLTTICPRVREETTCEYCYVMTARQSNTFVAKSMIDRIPYSGEILRLKAETINKLNGCGGLRMFSFGDYMPWMDECIEQIIIDAEKRRLLLKAITKQSEFIEKYKGRIFINFSIDLLNVDKYVDSIQTSRMLKLRCLVRNRSEVKEVFKYVDILTPYHGKKFNDFYRPKEAKEACAELAPEKTCCLTGKCHTCLVKCGNIN